MEATYFVGPEFDWLRNQVATVMWQPDRPVAQRPKDSVTRLYDAYEDQWKAAKTGQKRLAEVVKTKPQPALPTYRERQDAVTRTWDSTAPQAAAMSVEEYNRWRGESPANAAHAPYVFQKYPTTLYKDGNRIKVRNADDHDRLAKEGWKESP